MQAVSSNSEPAMLGPGVPDEIVSRKCAECQVCCMVLPVPELEKPPRRSCLHQCQQGCNIYEKRPESCKKFECLWKQSSILGEDLRPDRCGVMFDVYQPEKVVVALARGSEWEKGNANKLIEQMIKDGYVVWIRNTTATNLVLPEGVIESEAIDRLANIRKRLYGGS